MTDNSMVFKRWYIYEKHMYLSMGFASKIVRDRVYENIRKMCKRNRYYDVKIHRRNELHTWILRLERTEKKPNMDNETEVTLDLEGLL